MDKHPQGETETVCLSLWRFNLNENKPTKEEIQMKEFKKLYRASSVVYDSNGNNGISVSWYNADIKIYPVNYEDIIKDYAGMSSEIKMHAIKYVDEFFTSGQIKLLSQFVKKELGVELKVEEHNLPVVAQGIDKDNDEVVYAGFSEVEGKEGTCTIQLNKLDTYDLPFKAKGFYLQDDSKPSNDILEKLKTNYNIHNNMVDQIVPSDQWDEKETEQRCLEALEAGRVQMLGDTSLQDILEALADGRVRFVPAGSLAGMDIKNMKKFTIH